MALRKILFQVHLWTGLILGALLALIGLSGTVLVYDHELLAFGEKPLPRAEAPGPSLPLEAMLASARQASGNRRGPATITLPQEPGDAAIVRFLRGGAGRAGTDVYVDPASGRVLEVRQAAPNHVIGFLHQFHGNLALGREGRQAVGWLGVAMVVLGVTGLVLWWPKPGAFKRAFGVRKHVRGYWLHRELHGALGIWCWIVFIIVSFSGVVIVFPETTRAVISFGSAPQRPSFDPRSGPAVEPLRGVRPMSADAAVELVREKYPQADVRSVTLPGRGAMRVMIGRIDDGPVSVAFIDPWRKTIVALRNPPGSALDSFIAWQRPLHAGGGWGPIWRFLVALSGLLPSVFLITGVVMWLKKRRVRAKPSALRVLEGSDA